MQLTSIKNVCNILGGYAFKSNDFVNEGVPVVRIGDIKENKVVFNDKTAYVKEENLANYSKYIINKNDILVALSGATTGKVGVYLYDKPALLNQRVAKVSPKDSEQINKHYLRYCINNLSKEINEDALGVAQPNISPTAIGKMEIPMPEISIQEQIVKILNTAERLILKRQQQIEALSDLKQSIFLDIVKGNRKYSNVKLREVISSISAGLSTGGEDRVKKDGELGVLTTGAVTYGIFDAKAYKVPPNDKIKNKKLVFPSKYSILVSRMNTKELVGAACIVEEDYPDLFIPDRIWKLMPNKELINPYYLISVIQSRMFRIQIDRISTGTSGSMQNISQKNYMDLEIPYPDLETQNKLASKLSTINRHLAVLGTSLVEMKTLYDALLNKSFKGELFKEKELKV